MDKALADLIADLKATGEPVFQVEGRCAECRRRLTGINFLNIVDEPMLVKRNCPDVEACKKAWYHECDTKPSTQCGANRGDGLACVLLTGHAGPHKGYVKTFADVEWPNRAPCGCEDGGEACLMHGGPQ